MDGAASKALVQEWFSKGITSPAGRAMVADDFRWIGPHRTGRGYVSGA